MSTILKTLAVTLLAASLSYGASFDCRKASNDIEFMICDDDELSKLDEELAAAYRDAKNRRDIAELKGEQKYWMNNVRANCSTVSCLISTYRQRIDELYSYSERSNGASTKSWAGEYVLGNGYLKINRNLTFLYSSVGANDHLCGIESQFVDDGNTLNFYDPEGQEPCTLTVRKLNRNTISVTSSECREYCGARAYMIEGNFARQ